MDDIEQELTEARTAFQRHEAAQARGETWSDDFDPSARGRYDEALRAKAEAKALERAEQLRNDVSRSHRGTFRGQQEGWDTWDAENGVVRRG